MGRSLRRCGRKIPRTVFREASSSAIKNPTSPAVRKSLLISSNIYDLRHYSLPAAGGDDLNEWVCIDDDDAFDFGPVPSRLEAQSALKQVIEAASFSQLVRDETDVFGQAVKPSRFMHRAMSSVSDSDWSEPSFQLFQPRTLEAPVSGTVYDAFHLLQTEPSIQRMVISLSSDPEVWNAVLNNADVQGLRQFIPLDDINGITSLETDSDGTDEATSILKWLFNTTRSKAMEIIEMINKLVNDLFHHCEGDKTSTTSNACFEEKLRCSLMLTVVVLLIVAIDRAKSVQS